jgi:hypothetical protein
MNLFSRDPEPSPAERLKQLELAHAERLKALEAGRPLPEVELARAKAAEVRARAEAGRAIVATVFMAIGPAAVSGVAVAATAVVLAAANPAIHQAVLTIIWAGAGLVSLAIIAAGWAGSQRVPVRDLFRERPTLFSAREAEELAQAIQE